MANTTRFKDKNGREIFEGDVLYHELECVYDIVTWCPEFQYHLKTNINNTQDEIQEWEYFKSVPIEDVELWDEDFGNENYPVDSCHK